VRRHPARPGSIWSCSFGLVGLETPPGCGRRPVRHGRIRSVPWPAWCAAEPSKRQARIEQPVVGRRRRTWPPWRLPDATSRTLRSWRRRGVAVAGRACLHAPRRRPDGSRVDAACSSRCRHARPEIAATIVDTIYRVVARRLFWTDRGSRIIRAGSPHSSTMEPGATGRHGVRRVHRSGPPVHRPIMRTVILGRRRPKSSESPRPGRPPCRRSSAGQAGSRRRHVVGRRLAELEPVLAAHVPPPSATGRNRLVTWVEDLGSSSVPRTRGARAGMTFHLRSRCASSASSASIRAAQSSSQSTGPSKADAIRGETARHRRPQFPVRPRGSAPAARYSSASPRAPRRCC
jgi:hypothetical protein